MSEENITSVHIIADHYGLMQQIDICIEELAELIKELVKFKRNSELSYDSCVETIVEEYADVQIMLEQIKYLFNITDDIIDTEITNKVNRQLHRISIE